LRSERVVWGRCEERNEEIFVDFVPLLLELLLLWYQRNQKLFLKNGITFAALLLVSLDVCLSLYCEENNNKLRLVVTVVVMGWSVFRLSLLTSFTVSLAGLVIRPRVVVVEEGEGGLSGGAMN
jgi:hypothetical protein